MMTMKFFRSLFTASLIITSCTAAHAQFWSVGEEKPSTRWMTIENKTYKLIYPCGTDSLARVYLDELERFRTANGRSIGFRPGERSWGKIPVILHPFTATSNGSAAWAPKGMHLYAAPEYQWSDPMPWETQLAVHESRHVSQMQFGYKGLFMPFNYLFGEMWQGALLGLYPGQPLMEGDAVTAETALTPGGRGRTAKFLNYMDIALDSGDYRNYYRWIYGSYRHYAPDFYKIGYMTVAGMRYFYDDASFMKRYYDNITKNPFHIGNLQKTVRQASGKSFKSTFSDMMESYASMWKEEAAARAPFISAERVSKVPSFHTDYNIEGFIGDDIYVTVSGLLVPPELGILHPDGSYKRICTVSSEISQFTHDPVRERFYFSEEIQSPRFSLSGGSIIRYYDIRARKVRDLCTSGRLYNPNPSHDGTLVAAAEYPVTGGSALVLIETEHGRIVSRIPAPEGIQMTEAAWHGKTLYMIGISAEGYGLYHIDPHGDATWTCVSAPSIQTMAEIGTEGDHITFISDRDGQTELYCYSPAGNRFFQKTSTRFGMCGNHFSEDGSTMYFNMPTHEGTAIYKTAVSNLISKEVSMADVHKWQIADKLSMQEMELAGNETLHHVEDTTVSAPRRYGKLANLVKFHSWVPLYVNSDDLQSFSLEITNDDASLGFTGLFQNELSTFYGLLGYHAHKDEGKWRHSGHLRFVYSGWTPVIEGTVDFNERNNRQFFRRAYLKDGLGFIQNTVRNDNTPFVRGRVRLYIPYSFTKGGLRKGLIPSVSLTMTNDWFDTSVAYMTNDGNADETVNVYRLMYLARGHNVMMSTLSASLRGFIMRPMAPSQTFPSLGIGVEGGFGMRPMLDNVLSPHAYLYMYGYLPGFSRQQGLKLTALGQKLFKKKLSIPEDHTKILPRGYESTVSQYLYSFSNTQARLTADYAIPFYVGDISFLSPVLYATHFTLMPFYDMTLLKGGNLFSAGASLTLRTKNFAWFPFDGEMGIRVGYRGGSYYDDLHNAGVVDGHTSTEMIFSMDF